MDPFEPYFTDFLIPQFDLNASRTPLGKHIKDFQNRNHISPDFMSMLHDFVRLLTDVTRDSDSDILSDSVSTDTSVSTITRYACSDSRYSLKSTSAVKVNMLDVNVT